MAYAHSANGEGRRQELTEHLRAVAERGAEFANGFGAAELAHYAGLWHDVGKFSNRFQDYLSMCESQPHAHHQGPDHKRAGALLAIEHLPEAALLIQGHHGGLKSPSDFKAWLDQGRKDPDVTNAIGRAKSFVPGLEPPRPLVLPHGLENERLGAELCLRLLFSSLVDADFLDTEQHFQGKKSEGRLGAVSLAECWQRFARSHSRLPKLQGHVQDVRRRVYEACLRSANEPPGLFRLTVPTGGGKTLSGMAFALQHALAHSHRRVVVAVPFITITEQTADVYRSVFGDGEDDRPVVLEHHSGGGNRRQSDEDFSPREVWSRLAAENWDAPIVVTTTVQLFESLFSNRTQPCRKIHRLANSVIILDEAQALPPGLLSPILSMLRHLCLYFRTTVVLSTATQPAFEAIPEFSDLPAREIVPDAQHMFQLLKRVSYEWRTESTTRFTEIASILRAERQGLAVLNTKKDALRLLTELEDKDTFHLSTLLCGAHRRDVLGEIRRRLAVGEPCRLVSTQVIEAGVDIDFPLVIRAMGPLDAIIQSAGRCNREGRMNEGRVVVLEPEEGGMPPGPYRIATDVTRALSHDGGLDVDDPRAAIEYFHRLFQTVDTDDRGIQKLRERLSFEQVAQSFRLIDEETEALVVRYGSAREQGMVEKIAQQLQAGTPRARTLLRRLQPYMVSVRSREMQGYRRMGFVEDLLPGVGFWQGSYNNVLGLCAPNLNVEDLVV